MLPRKARLRRNRDFDSVYKRGKCYPGKDLILHVLATDPENQKFGFSISKKVSKRAVDRNRLKRQLSHVVREELKYLQKGVDVIFVVRKNLLNLSFSDLKFVVKSLLEKAKLYT